MSAKNSFLFQSNSNTFTFEKSFPSKYKKSIPIEKPLKSPDFLMNFPSSITKPYRVTDRGLITSNIPILDEYQGYFSWDSSSNNKIDKTHKNMSEYNEENNEKNTLKGEKHRFSMDMQTTDIMKTNKIRMSNRLHINNVEKHQDLIGNLLDLNSAKNDDFLSKIQSKIKINREKDQKEEQNIDQMEEIIEKPKEIPKKQRDFKKLDNRRISLAMEEINNKSKENKEKSKYFARNSIMPKSKLDDKPIEIIEKTELKLPQKTTTKIKELNEKVEKIVQIERNIMALSSKKVKKPKEIFNLEEVDQEFSSLKEDLGFSDNGVTDKKKSRKIIKKSEKSKKIPQFEEKIIPDETAEIPKIKLMKKAKIHRKTKEKSGVSSEETFKPEKLETNIAKLMSFKEEILLKKYEELPSKTPKNVKFTSEILQSHQNIENQENPLKNEKNTEISKKFPKYEKPLKLDKNKEISKPTSQASLDSIKSPIYSKQSIKEEVLSATSTTPIKQIIEKPYKSIDFPKISPSKPIIETANIVKTSLKIKETDTNSTPTIKEKQQISINPVIPEKNSPTTKKNLSLVKLSQTSRKSEEKLIAKSAKFNNIAQFHSKEDIFFGSPQQKSNESFDLDKELSSVVEKIEQTSQIEEKSQISKKSTFSLKSPKNKTLSKIPHKPNIITIDPQRFSAETLETPLTSSIEPPNQETTMTMQKINTISKIPRKAIIEDDAKKFQMLLAKQKKEEIQAFICNLQSNLEESLLSQYDCIDRLKTFFDDTQNTLNKVNKEKPLFKNIRQTLKFSNQIKEPIYKSTSEQEIKKYLKQMENKDELSDDEDEGLMDAPMIRIAGDFYAEKIRRKAFLKQKNVFDIVKRFMGGSLSIVKQSDIIDSMKNDVDIDSIDCMRIERIIKDDKSFVEEKTCVMTEDSKNEKKRENSMKKLKIETIKNTEMSEISLKNQEFSNYKEENINRSVNCKNFDEFFSKSKKKHRLRLKIA